MSIKRPLAEFAALVAALAVVLHLYFRAPFDVGSERTPAVAQAEPPTAGPRDFPEAKVFDEQVTIYARLVEEIDEYREFKLRVEGFGASYTIGSAVVSPGSLTDAEEVVRRGIGWKDDVLFVRSSCGGGNAWRCDLDYLFTVRDGRLVKLGSVAGVYGEPVGASYQDGYITDDFDALESNGFTSHAGAPHFALYLKIDGAQLVVDVDRTWEGHQEKFLSNLAQLECVADALEGTQPCPYQTDIEAVHSALLENAALAEYCGRLAEYEASLDLARRSLTPDELAMFEAEIARVVPGALPAPRRDY